MRHSLRASVNSLLRSVGTSHVFKMGPAMGLRTGTIDDDKPVTV